MGRTQKAASARWLQFAPSSVAGAATVSEGVGRSRAGAWRGRWEKEERARQLVLGQSVGRSAASKCATLSVSRSNETETMGAIEKSIFALDKKKSADERIGLVFEFALLGYFFVVSS